MESEEVVSELELYGNYLDEAICRWWNSCLYNWYERRLLIHGASMALSECNELYSELRLLHDVTLIYEQIESE